MRKGINTCPQYGISCCISVIITAFVEHGPSFFSPAALRLRLLGLEIDGESVSPRASSSPKISFAYMFFY